MASEAQRKAVSRYDKENTKSITVKLNRKTDADIIEWMDTKENRQGYIKEIIRKDMEKVKYEVYWVGGELDGKVVGTFDTENEAITFARKFYSEHEKEFHSVWGGVGISDTNGKEVVDW